MLVWNCHCCQKLSMFTAIDRYCPALSLAREQPGPEQPRREVLTMSSVGLMLCNAPGVLQNARVCIPRPPSELRISDLKLPPTQHTHAPETHSNQPC
jgi:hypothetical protein